MHGHGGRHRADLDAVGDNGGGGGEEEEELQDLTESLVLHSKRTERQRKKRQKKLTTLKSSPKPRALQDLPYELIVDILSLLRPSDIFRLSRTCKPMQAFILQERRRLASNIIDLRYPCLQKCFRLPARLDEVDASAHRALRNEDRQKLMAIHKKYQHIQPLDSKKMCSCLTCVLRWNGLGLIVDFNHWQPNLEKRDPIPIIMRGTDPPWNKKLIANHAAVVWKATKDPLWYAGILEAHLESTTRSIRWHSMNKGNKRARFRMTEEDVKAGTDAFLQRSGPPTLDFPFQRDNYYMLEAYLPNRGWSKDLERWMYVPAEQHDKDVEMVVKWEQRSQVQRAGEDNNDRTASSSGLPMPINP